MTITVFALENKKSDNKIKGDIGENVGCVFLKNKGFEIVCRNYRRPWGELDIVAVKDRITHFFEVKSVTVGRFSADPEVYEGYRPEDRVNAFKLGQIRRMIQTYLVDQKISPDRGFQFHVLSVYLNVKQRKARVVWMENLII